MINSFRPRMAHGIQTRTSSLGLIILLCLLFGSAHLSAAPEADLWSFWDKADEQSTRQVDHGEWSAILERYVSHDDRGNALVDYAAVNKQDAASLKRYIASLAEIDPRTLRKPEQMAYWFNLYNALTVQLVIEAYPVSSIKKVKGGFFNKGPWDEEVVTIANEALTLNDIEHRILRPIWQDKRIHYAVNCASIGCPNLAANAYEADKLEQQLDAAASTFINQRKGVASLGEGRFELSSIYDWYGEDFGTEAELFQHLQAFHKDRLLTDGKAPADIDYNYDWSLNDIGQ
ncbi:DUF547 domain-containing protein [Allohahella marinimesophila]|uniref:DUF547 domain-containing protein n=1 Tax=Allohahella marinimesophila TaxID=1054972 RepID=A0ABP7NRF5_9GAMM